MNLEHVPCYNCGNANTTEFFIRKDALTRKDTEFTVVKCRTCGLLYLNPRPSPMDIVQFYPDEFVSYQFEIIPKIKKSLRYRMLSKIVAQASLDKLVFVKNLIKKPNASILDMGCGKGGFLYVAQQAGYDVTGLDFDTGSINYCKQTLHVPVINGAAESLWDIDRRFDAITMWHFLEHSFNPLEVLKATHKLLAHDGYLVIEVPNAESLENEWFGKHSYLYDVPRHLVHFSPKTISQMLGKAGFRMEALEFVPFSGGWLGSVQQLFFNGKVFARLKEHIFMFSLLSLLCYPFDKLSCAMNYGSIMRITAQKASNP